MIYDIVNTIAFSMVAYGYFIQDKPLNWVTSIVLIFNVLFWILPSIFGKSKICNKCKLDDGRPQTEDYTNSREYMNVMALWRKKKSILKKFSTDIMGDISDDLFIIHKDLTIVYVGVIETYTLAHAEQLDRILGEGHQVSTLEAYLKYFEKEISK